MSASTVAPARRAPADVREAAKASVEGTVTTEDLVEVDREATNRWFGITAIALLMVGLGLMVTSPALVVGGVVAVWYAVYYRLPSDPAPQLRLTREVDTPTPTPGEEVTVTLAVENVGSSTVADLRLIDGVPPALTVDDGSPRLATALRPGQRATIAYRVTARRGYHGFDPVDVIVRDIAGRVQVTYEASVESILRCEPDPEPIEPPLLRQLTARVSGRIETTRGGPGVEFHAVREYRPGDPLNRIDWSRKARTGELATVEFRREQMATVVLVIDVRPQAYVAPAGDDVPAAEHGIDAAASLFFSLLDAGDRVGVTTLGARTCWLPPDIGSDHRTHGRTLFAAHPSLSSTPPSDTVSVATEGWELDHRLPSAAQLLFVTPLADGGAERYAIRFEARGHPVTIVSPNPCSRDSVGQRVATVERQLRIDRLRERGIHVVDWEPDTSLPVALDAARHRWSR